MRTLYLVRHGQPIRFKDGHCCISRTDLPLSDVGREHADMLKNFFKGCDISAIYTSPAVRCMETARIISGDTIPLFIKDSLWEIDVGQWEGLPFSEIKERWPELYAARGAHLGTVPPPGGESFEEAALRMERTISNILSESKGDIAVVSHSGIIRAWYSRMCELDMDDVFSVPQPYGCVTMARMTEGEETSVIVSKKPNLFPGPVEINFLFEQYNTPVNIRLHCQAVAEKALLIAKTSLAPVNSELLKCACLLHDIARTEGKSHPQKGAEALRKAGYPSLADIIEQHHDLAPDASPEAELLYLADKMIQGVDTVSIEERFEASKLKCKTEEAMAAWRSRYQTTLDLCKKYNCYK